MRKRLFPVLLAVTILLSGCLFPAQPREKQYTATFLDLFDTLTTIIGFGETEDDFRRKAQVVHDDLLYYHQLFDIYNDYDGLNNLKTVNDQAGIAPVRVDPTIIRLLQDCKTYWEMTDGRVNAAMGSVLRLWHDARSAGIDDPGTAKLPDMELLRTAAEHTGFDAVILNEEDSTVYITDPETSLDVGAIAKGWATQKVAENAPQGMLISVGGNVCATGPKTPEGTPWVIGVQDPKGGEDYLHTIYVSGGTVVTSGDYQRTYTVEGKQYHHIIDPDTLMPGEYWSSVTVVCDNSGLADALSTALFLLPLEEGRVLAAKWSAEVLWLSPQGEEHMTPGFRDMIRT
ncbi:MAG: FAD:protein FMN transferase [Ruminococcaceae bacterium]|nr:FAD:protein FMN transferase [Oscillospiraceae bacterium]